MFEISGAVIGGRSSWLMRVVHYRLVPSNLGAQHVVLHHAAMPEAAMWLSTRARLKSPGRSTSSTTSQTSASFRQNWVLLVDQAQRTRPCRRPDPGRAKSRAEAEHQELQREGEASRTKVLSFVQPACSLRCAGFRSSDLQSRSFCAGVFGGFSEELLGSERLAAC